MSGDEEASSGPHSPELAAPRGPFPDLPDVTTPGPADADDVADLARCYEAVRGVTARLAEPLSPEDCSAQSMTDASPTKWHLAHTTWFFETFVLAPALPGYREYEPSFRVLFNSYYHSVGEQHPRPERGLLTRPDLDEVQRYRAHVDAHMLELLHGPLERVAPRAAAVRLGLEHEQQHQELILTDVKHLLGCNPLRPAYARTEPIPEGEEKPIAWTYHPGGVVRIGHDGQGFSFDNETPRHRTLLEPFELASRLVTNADFQAFMSDGGYERPDLWLSDGWAVANEQGWSEPLYWEQRDGVWLVHTLGGLRELRPHEPVVHVSLYEADAYARWACARLPTEAEWEGAACKQALDGNFVESGYLHPAPAPRGAPADAPAQLFGDCWEWTQSAYAPYPGFKPAAGAFGEYNGKFMCNQFVLRGGSCVTSASHVRATYRNFFFPDQRWQFSGIRLARDAG